MNRKKGLLKPKFKKESDVDLEKNEILSLDYKNDIIRGKTSLDKKAYPSFNSNYNINNKKEGKKFIEVENIKPNKNKRNNTTQKIIKKRSNKNKEKPKKNNLNKIQNSMIKNSEQKRRRNQ